MTTPARATLKRRPTPEWLRERIEALGEWFHNFTLGGVQTAPAHALGDYPAVKWNRFAEAIPDDLRGWSVLDIGCNAGFYSQEMKRRGADRVLGIDSDERYLAQARFAAEVNGLEIEFRQMSVYDLPALRERFDLVLFMGVLYHLRYPLLALDLISLHCLKRILVFQSMLRGSPSISDFPNDFAITDGSPFEDPDFPCAYFIEHSYAGDPTNWWIPNRAAAEAMLRSAGLEIVAHPEEEVFICRPKPEPRLLSFDVDEVPWLKR